MTDPRKEHDEAYLAKIANRRALRMSEEAEAAFVDGEKESVNIRQLSIREVEAPTFMSTVLSEASFLELVCDRPEGWSDGLTMESHSVLLAKAHEINRPTWLQRQERSTDLMMAMTGQVNANKDASTSSSSTPLEA